MSVFLGFYGVLLFERICEKVIARRNARWILAQGGVEHDRGFTHTLILFHVAWFISFLVEGLLRPAGPLFPVPLIIAAFIALQSLRYWCIVSLGHFWNTGLLVLSGAAPVRIGPYRFLKHPNYIVVLIEIPLYPLLFQCNMTAAVFGIANVLMLGRRIRKENQVLDVDYVPER